MALVLVHGSGLLVRGHSYVLLLQGLFIDPPCGEYQRYARLIMDGAGLGPWQWASCEGTPVCPPVAISLVGCSRQLLMACRNHGAFELVATIGWENSALIGRKATLVENRVASTHRLY